MQFNLVEKEGISSGCEDIVENIVAISGFFFVCLFVCLFGLRPLFDIWISQKFSLVPSEFEISKVDKLFMKPPD